MTGSPRTTTRCAVRRLAIARQHLAGPPSARASRDDILTVVRDLAYVQIDPFSTAVPTHVLSLWSRVRNLRLADLDRLLWRERKLLELTIPPAGIVAADDYPLHYSMMGRYPGSLSDSWGGQRRRAADWLATHDELRRSILEQLDGAELTLNEFGGHVRTKRREDGWTSGSDVAVTLGYMEMTGEVMIVGHQGNLNVWGTPTDFLPGWVERTEIPQEELEARCAQRALRALGVGSASDINYYFPRGRYLDLRGTLDRLESAGTVHRVQVVDQPGKEARYVHDHDVSALADLETAPWEPRASLIAPFDNLIMGRGRTLKLFGLDYVHGNYLPEAKRKHGLFVVPILWEDRLVGRLDPRLDREKNVLEIRQVTAEPGAPKERSVGRGIAETVDRFAEFLGARGVTYASKVPRFWKGGLR